MEHETQPSNSSTPHAYVTAPTSPVDFAAAANFYYSAPVSPRRKPDNRSIFADFEFETSKKFSGRLEWAPAFADELFLDGLVMPLKLPPRLQYDSDSLSHKSSPARKNPVSRKGSWNDDFDPFMAALQKVREDKNKRGRNIQRSRSYSPFRAIVARCSSECGYYEDDDHGFSEESSPKQGKGPSFSGPLLNLKDTGQGPRRLLSGERVRPLRIDPARIDDKRGNGNESKVQKLKGFLMKYVLFGRGNHEAKSSNKSVKNKAKNYNRLGFKSKENSNSRGKF